MTTRWTFYDPATAESWTVPINPDSMTSPEPPAKVVRHARGRVTYELHTSTQRAVTFLEKPQSRDWEFSGAIRTQAHYEGLRDWVAKDHAVRVSDHLGRIYLVYLTDFKPTDRPPTRSVTWRLRYTVKAKILEQLA